jgi:hypothetical protein
MEQPFMPSYHRLCLEESLASITGSKQAAQGPRIVVQSYESGLSSQYQEQGSNIQKLCARCISIGVASFLDIGSQSEISLGLLLDIQSQQDCDFAHL